MIKLPPPITQETFKKVVSQWASITKRNDSASIINLSNREQLWRINQLLQDKEVRELFSPSEIIIINLASFPIEEVEDLELFLAKNRDRDRHSIVLFILNADRLFEEKQPLLSFFNSLPQRNSEYRLLFFFQKIFFCLIICKNCLPFLPSIRISLYIPYIKSQINYSSLFI